VMTLTIAREAHQGDEFRPPLFRTMSPPAKFSDHYGVKTPGPHLSLTVEFFFPFPFLTTLPVQVLPYLSRGRREGLITFPSLPSSPLQKLLVFKHLVPPLRGGRAVTGSIVRFYPSTHASPFPLQRSGRRLTLCGTGQSKFGMVRKTNSFRYVVPPKMRFSLSNAFRPFPS